MKMWPKNTVQAVIPRSDVLKSAGGAPAPAERLHYTETSGAGATAGTERAEVARSPEGAPMAEVPVIHMHENTPEQIAYKLFLHIVAREQISLAPGQGVWPVDRKWILSTYAECMKAVRHGVVD